MDTEDHQKAKADAANIDFLVKEARPKNISDEVWKDFADELAKTIFEKFDSRSKGPAGDLNETITAIKQCMFCLGMSLELEARGYRNDGTDDYVEITEKRRFNPED